MSFSMLFAKGVAIAALLWTSACVATPPQPSGTAAPPAQLRALSSCYDRDGIAHDGQGMPTGSDTLTEAQVAGIQSCLTAHGYPPRSQAEATADVVDSLDTCLSDMGLPPSRNGKTDGMSGGQVETLIACLQRQGMVADI